MCEGATDGGNDAAETGADGDRSSVEERYRTVFEHNNDAVMLVDLEEEEAFIDVNPKACELRKFEEKASR